MSVRPQLPGYVFTDKLGSGSYATVYKAFSKGHGREVVAVKCVSKASLNKTATENLLTEISILKKLKHENIVKLKDFLWDDNFIYLIMEFCSGGDLSTFVKTRRTLPERIVKRFLQQLALALQYLRTQDIAHMDLKPQNILLLSRNNPVLKVADFGFARHLKLDDDVTSMRGSPLYMAPEILMKHKYDARVDLWSVGVILYECLFGKAPYSSQSFGELAQKIMDPTPIKIPYGVDISDDCRDLVLQLLQRDPDNRITFEKFFNHPFTDLQHLPSEHSYTTAVKLVSEAVVRDEEGNYADAIKLYCQALQHFVLAVNYEPDVQRKEAIRERTKEYLSRAEQLKVMLKPQQSVDQPDSLTPFDELVKLTPESSHMMAAFKVAQAADQLNKAEMYQQASDKYHLALGALIPMLSAEPKGRRRDLMHSQVEHWMKKAECIKEYLEVSQIPMDVEDGKEMAESLRKQCCIQ